MDNQCGNCTVSLLISTGASSDGSDAGENHDDIHDKRQQQRQQQHIAGEDGDEHNGTATISTDIRTTELPTTTVMSSSGHSLSAMVINGSADRSTNNDTPMTRFSDISPSIMDSEGPSLGLPTPLTLTMMNTVHVTTGSVLTHRGTEMETSSYVMELKGMEFCCFTLSHTPF